VVWLSWPVGGRFVGARRAGIGCPVGLVLGLAAWCLPVGVGRVGR
jgi:hypothetical protein